MATILSALVSDGELEVVLVHRQVFEQSALLNFAPPLKSQRSPSSSLPSQKTSTTSSGTVSEFYLPRLKLGSEIDIDTDVDVDVEAVSALETIGAILVSMTAAESSGDFGFVAAVMR